MSQKFARYGLLHIFEANLVRISEDRRLLSVLKH